MARRYTRFIPLPLVLVCLLICGCSNSRLLAVAEPSEPPKQWRCSGDRETRQWLCSDRGEYPEIPEPRAVKRPEAVAMPEPVAELSTAEESPAVEQSATEAPDGDRVLAAPPHYFAIQLVAAANADAVDNYGVKLRLQRPLRVRIASHGQLWYVLLEDIYQSYQAADDALSQLRSKHPDLPAWIRSVAGLQDAMRKADRELR